VSGGQGQVKVSGLFFGHPLYFSVDWSLCGVFFGVRARPGASLWRKMVSRLGSVVTAFM